MRAEGRWVVETLAVGGELVPPLEGTTLTLELDSARVGGSGGINRFMGALNQEPPPLFGPLATTMRAGPPDHMAQEDIYLRHLGAVDGLEVEAGEIRLVSGDLVVVTLKPAETDPVSKNVR